MIYFTSPPPRRMDDIPSWKERIDTLINEQGIDLVLPGWKSEEKTFSRGRIKRKLLKSHEGPVICIIEDIPRSELIWMVDSTFGPLFSLQQIHLGHAKYPVREDLEEETEDHFLAVISSSFFSRLPPEELSHYWRFLGKTIPPAVFTEIVVNTLYPRKKRIGSLREAAERLFKITRNDKSLTVSIGGRIGNSSIRYPYFFENVDMDWGDTTILANVKKPEHPEKDFVVSVKTGFPLYECTVPEASFSVYMHALFLPFLGEALFELLADEGNFPRLESPEGVYYHLIFHQKNSFDSIRGVFGFPAQTDKRLLSTKEPPVILAFLLSFSFREKMRAYLLSHPTLTPLSQQYFSRSPIQAQN